jgi:hypothetical protein
MDEADYFEMLISIGLQSVITQKTTSREHIVSHTSDSSLKPTCFNISPSPVLSTFELLSD